MAKTALRKYHPKMYDATRRVVVVVVPPGDAFVPVVEEEEEEEEGSLLVVARTLLRAASSASAGGAGGSRRAGASSEGVGAPPSRRAAERGADPRREKATVRGEDERTRTSPPRARETPGWAPRRARVEATPRASASADPLERRVMPRVVTAPRVLARKPPGRAQGGTLYAASNIDERSFRRE
jgi:hypothetical protein